MFIDRHLSETAQLSGKMRNALFREQLHRWRCCGWQGSRLSGKLKRRGHTRVQRTRARTARLSRGAAVRLRPGGELLGGGKGGVFQAGVRNGALGKLGSPDSA